jgi:hypothetical protein
VILHSAAGREPPRLGLSPSVADRLVGQSQLKTLVPAFSPMFTFGSHQ